MKEKIYVEISGIKLGIISEEGAEYVQGVAKGVEEQISAMLKAQKNCSLIEAALFCAMSFYSQSTENTKKLKNLEAQISLYQASTSRLKRENEELRSKLNDR